MRWIRWKRGMCLSLSDWIYWSCLCRVSIRKMCRDSIRLSRIWMCLSFRICWIIYYRILFCMGKSLSLMKLGMFMRVIKLPERPSKTLSKNNYLKPWVEYHLWLKSQKKPLTNSSNHQIFKSQLLKQLPNKVISRPRELHPVLKHNRF